MASEDSGKITNIEYFKTQQEWKEWLQRNSENSHVVWLQFYRPHTDKPILDIKETIATAKEFDWKHTLIKRIDDDCYARKFVPIAETAEKPDDSPDTKAKEDKESDTPDLPILDDVFITKGPENENMDDQEDLIVELPEPGEEIDDDTIKDEDDHFIAPLDDLFEDKEKEMIEEPEKSEEDDIFVEELTSQEEEEEQKQDKEIFFPAEKADDKIYLQHDLDEEDEIIITDITDHNLDDDDKDIFIDKSNEELTEKEEDIEAEELITPEDEIFEDEIKEEEPQTELEIDEDEPDKIEPELQEDNNEPENELQEDSAEEEEEEFVRKVTPTFRKK